MRCLVSCGPTYEPLDEVRRLTNFSTGKLGIGLANFLLEAGHEVTLLKGSYTICADPFAGEFITFTTTQDLLDRFRKAAKQGYDAIFHAAAVSDFRFGAVHRRAPDGKIEPVASRKFATREGSLFAELIPTQKILGQLRPLFPSAIIVGWKYEVDGTRESAIGLGEKQIAESRTNCCVVNGPAYGKGLGLVRANGVEHCGTAEELYTALILTLPSR
jgi:phosphopantothenate---cysteine ligase (CTP)